MLVSQDQETPLRTPAPPLPPPELRRLVCHDDALFQLRDDGAAIFPYLSDERWYRSVFDFGCGCGRIARQLLVQQPRPARYVGIDINRPMIDWCQRQLSPLDSGFQFFHHDVWNLGLGSDNTRQRTAPFPVESSAFTLVVAHSVFTHLYQDQTDYYLGELSRILDRDGVARTTWFLFDRATFPMLFDFQVTLFVNEIDATNAVIYDWEWLLQTLRKHGLRVMHTIPPPVRGHQWELYLCKAAAGEEHAFPTDVATRLRMCSSSVEAEIIGNDPRPESPAVPATPVEISGRKSIVPRNGHVLRFSSAMSVDEAQRRVTELPWWYHSYYFDNGFSVRGDYDIGADVAGYGFPESMEGLRVLDVGTGAGWFALYFEQLGATVTTVDARGYCDFDMYGRYNYPSIEKDREADRVDEQGRPVYFSPVSRGFWTMKEILGSAVTFRNSRVYDLNPSLFGGEKFDIVFLGAILCHLRDPIGALMAVRSVCRHRVIVSTPVVLGEPESETLPRQYLPYTDADKISWWLPNEACFRHWFLAAGFTGVDVSRQVTLRADVVRVDNGKPANGDQTLRIGTAFVP